MHNLFRAEDIVVVWIRTQSAQKRIWITTRIPRTPAEYGRERQRIGRGVSRVAIIYDCYLLRNPEYRVLGTIGSSRARFLGRRFGIVPRTSTTDEKMVNAPLCYSRDGFRFENRSFFFRNSAEPQQTTRIPSDTALLHCNSKTVFSKILPQYLLCMDEHRIVSDRFGSFRISNTNRSRCRNPTAIIVFC